MNFQNPTSFIALFFHIFRHVYNVEQVIHNIWISYHHFGDNLERMIEKKIFLLYTNYSAVFCTFILSGRFSPPKIVKKLRRKGFMLSMKKKIEEIWDDVLVKLEQEHDVSSAAINAWIKPLHIKDVHSNKIILSLDAKYDERGIQFIKKKMYDFYISLAIQDLTGTKYDIVFELYMTIIT